MFGRLLGWYTIYTFSGGGVASLEIQDAKNDFKIRHLGTIAHLSQAISMQRRHISTIGKKHL